MKMKSIFLIAILTVTQIFAHRVMMMIDDNGDGTVTIETGVSSGGNASGSKIILTDRVSGRPLAQSVVPDSGVVTMKRPNVPYSVTLKMDEGHAVTEPGPELLPIAPKNDTLPVAAKADSLPAESTKTDAASADSQNK